MKVALNGTGVAALAGLVVAVAGLGYLLVRFGPQLKTLVTKTLNPASSDNIVNQGVSAGVSAAVGYDESLGGYVADKVFAIMHPDFFLNQTTQSQVKPTVAPAIDYTSSSYYDLGAKPVPNDASAAIGKSGVLTDSAYRDQVR